MVNVTREEWSVVACLSYDKKKLLLLLGFPKIECIPPHFPDNKSTVVARTTDNHFFEIETIKVR